MKKMRKNLQILVLLAVLLPTLATSQNTSGDIPGSSERRFWGWQTNEGGSGISYCDGQCAAIITTQTYYIFWIAVDDRPSIIQVTEDCPCGTYSL